jgi:GNAT superfamily N-acetyltransferase
MPQLETNITMSPVEYRVINKAELSKVRTLELSVAAEVGSDRYVPLSESAVVQSIDAGLAVGAFSGKEIIGVCIAFVEAVDYQTFVSKLPNSEEILRPASFVRFAYVVSPASRGGGITGELLQRAMKQARDSDYKHAIATVAVNNGPSINILLKAGFDIKYVGPVYGEKVRMITHRALHDVTPRRAPSVWTDSSDVLNQQKLLSQGLVGVEAKRQGENTLIGYA